MKKLILTTLLTIIYLTSYTQNNSITDVKDITTSINPTIDLIGVEVKDEYKSLMLYNQQGDYIKTIQKINTYIADLPSGIYYVKIKSVTNKVYKFVKI